MHLQMPHRLVRLGNAQLLQIFEAQEFRNAVTHGLHSVCGRIDITPWSRSGDLDVAELGLLNIAVHSTTASLLGLRDRCINAMRSLSIVEPGAEGTHGRGFPRYTLCAGSIGAADTKALDAVIRSISAASLVNAAAISVLIGTPIVNLNQARPARDLKLFRLSLFGLRRGDISDRAVLLRS